MEEESSRLIVKHIPKYLNEARLVKVFEPFGDVTDCVIRRNKKKVSREFGFIGYKTHEEAKAALEKLNNTYIDTCKISVEN